MLRQEPKISEPEPHFPQSVWNTEGMRPSRKFIGNEVNPHERVHPCD